MKATTTRRGGAGALPANKKTKKKKEKAALGFMCGCGGSESVATVSRAAATISAAAATRTTLTTTNTTVAAPGATKPPATAASPNTTSDHDAGKDDDAAEASVDALLQQLRELELGVRALGVREREGDAGAGAHGNDTPRTRPRRNRRSGTDDRGGGARSRSGRLDAESVAVVTESADPLEDFRRSMVQMIVANGITGGAELRELLQRFLSLNAPRHHHLILLAFADVWEELFAGGGGSHLVPDSALTLVMGAVTTDTASSALPTKKTCSTSLSLLGETSDRIASYLPAI